MSNRNDQNHPGSAVPYYEAPSKAASYRVQASNIAVYALATDVLILRNTSATKKVSVKKIQVTIDAPGAAVLDIYVFKRATLNTGGTKTAPAIFKLSSANPAPAAVAELYSALPTLTDAGVLVAGDHYSIPATTGNTFASPPWIEYFGYGAQALEILGLTEQLCIGFNGQTIPAGCSAYIQIEWTEEDL